MIVVLAVVQCSGLHAVPWIERHEQRVPPVEVLQPEQPATMLCLSGGLEFRIGELVRIQRSGRLARAGNKPPGACFLGHAARDQRRRTCRQRPGAAGRHEQDPRRDFLRQFAAARRKTVRFEQVGGDIDIAARWQSPRVAERHLRTHVVHEHLERKLPPVIQEAVPLEGRAGDPEKVLTMAAGAVLLELFLAPSGLCGRVDAVQHRRCGLWRRLCRQ